MGGKRGARLKPEHPSAYDIGRTDPGFVDFLTKDAIERRDKEHLAYLLQRRQTPLPQFLCRMLAQWLYPGGSVKKTGPKPGYNVAEQSRNFSMIREYIKYDEAGENLTVAKGLLCEKHNVSERLFDDILAEYREKILACRAMFAK